MLRKLLVIFKKTPRQMRTLKLKDGGKVTVLSLPFCHRSPLNVFPWLWLNKIIRKHMLGSENFTCALLTLDFSCR